MADRTSTLPDDVVCYILSFLPMKDMVATCVLSKRWEPLWRSVPALNFDCDRDLHSFEAFLQKRDLNQPLQRLCLRCCYRRYCYCTPICDPNNFYQLEFLTTTVQHRLEHLDLSIPYIKLSSVVLSCKTLVVFKLTSSYLKAFSSVDLPSLKILHLDEVFFSEYRLLAELLSGCPNLEDMKAIELGFGSYLIEAKFKKLSKLVRVCMDKDKISIPLEVVCNAQFLCIDWWDNDKVEIVEDLIPEFHNLTCIEFGFVTRTIDWLEVLKMLKHCPKLQTLVINQGSPADCECDMGEWQYPLCVPKCISSHLKTCRIDYYGGNEPEFEFARYIMQNARLLRHGNLDLL